MIIVAVIVIPYKLGGWDEIFGAAETKFAASPNPGDGVILAGPAQLQYATLAFGSALALFLYPHSITGVLASRDRNVIKRNMAALPAYSLHPRPARPARLHGHRRRDHADHRPTPARSTATPSCRCCSTTCSRAGSPASPSPPSAIGALVPAAIMSIAAANLWTRNIYKEYINKDATPKQEARSSKLASLVVKVGALVAILALDPQFSIDLQLIGGIIILQTLPAVALGLYTRGSTAGA